MRPFAPLFYRISDEVIFQRFNWKIWIKFHDFRWWPHLVTRQLFKRFSFIPRSYFWFFSHHIVFALKWFHDWGVEVFVERRMIYRPYYIIYWSTRSNKPILALQDKKRRTLLHVYSGLLIKYFENKKNLRKSKLVTLTLFNYFRSLLLVSPARNFYLITKGPSPFIKEFFSILFRKPKALFANYKFEKDDPLFIMINTPFNFLYMFYTHNQSYCFQKTRAQGRIKRKIRRRLVSKNEVIDS